MRSKQSPWRMRPPASVLSPRLAPCAACALAALLAVSCRAPGPCRGGGARARGALRALRLRALRLGALHDSLLAKRAAPPAEGGAPSLFSFSGGSGILAARGFPASRVRAAIVRHENESEMRLCAVQRSLSCGGALLGRKMESKRGSRKKVVTYARPSILIFFWQHFLVVSPPSFRTPFVPSAYSGCSSTVSFFGRDSPCAAFAAPAALAVSAAPAAPAASAAPATSAASVRAAAWAAAWAATGL